MWTLFHYITHKTLKVYRSVYKWYKHGVRTYASIWKFTDQSTNGTNMGYGPTRLFESLPISLQMVQTWGTDLRVYLKVYRSVYKWYKHGVRTYASIRKFTDQSTNSTNMGYWPTRLCESLPISLQMVQTWGTDLRVNLKVYRSVYKWYKHATYSKTLSLGQSCDADVLNVSCTRVRCQSFDKTYKKIEKWNIRTGLDGTQLSHSP